MHAYLIVCPDQVQTESKISELIKNSTRRNWELAKISDVRDLEKFTKLSLNAPTAIVINDFNLSSIAAQNAFLKNLEEPQKKLEYILTASASGNILPTVLSRCEVINIKSAKTHSDKFLRLATDFTKSEDYESRYKIFTKITKREEAIEFVECILSQKGSIKLLEKALLSYTALQKNGNVALQLTNLAI